MPKGCILSLIGSLLTMLAGSVFFIEYSVDYDKIELTSIFSDLPYLEIITYLLAVIGTVVLGVGLFRLFFGKQEEPDSDRGGLVKDDYTNKYDQYNKV